jgi:glycosyltransferase involved in cell wall biosynthesis
MFEECVPGALGVITHSRFFSDRVHDVFPGPVQHIPLAYPVDCSAAPLSRSDLRMPADRIVLLTVGNVNRNKRVDEVIECLGANRELASKVFYLVCGYADTDTMDRLAGLIARQGLADSVRLTGHVSDEELRSYLHAAGICVNLRNPAMEGGSASLVEMMLHGKAVIVSDTGVYAEVPDSCVIKARTAHESEDLARALTALVDDAGLRKQLGERARVYAEANFTPHMYTEKLLQFLDLVSTLKPVLEPTYRAARTLFEIGIRPDSHVARNLAAVVADVFCGPADAAPWNRDRE